MKQVLLRVPKGMFQNTETAEALSQLCPKAAGKKVVFSDPNIKTIPVQQGAYYVLDEQHAPVQLDGAFQLAMVPKPAQSDMKGLGINPADNWSKNFKYQ